VSARNWVEIDEARLVENYAQVRAAAGAETEVLAVVKANAYGHGLEQCAVVLARAGATWLGVGDAKEGARARRALGEAGAHILVMGGVMRGEVGAIAEHGLTPVVWTREQVEWLGAYPGMRVHVEIETGMGRQGVRPGAELKELLRAIADAGLELDGVCTHFASAEVVGSAKTREQRVRFAEAGGQVRELGLRPRWIHAGSSASIDIGADVDGSDGGWLVELAKSVGAQAMVRCGIALYGYCLAGVAEEGASGEPVAGVRHGELSSRIRAKLRPVMTWKTRVLDVREVQAGETIGYNATFTAKRAMRVALLPVGYADGLRRELSGMDNSLGGWVMARGADGVARRADIVGRVSMSMTSVDVTGIDGARVGDEVVLLGDGVTADDHARIAGTIPYEILCVAGKR